MYFIYFVVGLFVCQVYASVLPLGHILLGRQFGPSDAPTDSSCESECAKWIDLGLTCSTEDLKCLCTEEYTASVKTCADCYLATPDATTEEKAPLAEAYNGYISNVTYVCKEIYGIDLPAINITVPGAA